MVGYDYGNARLRAMKSQLLTVSELKKMAEAGNLHTLIAGLTRTPYRKAVEAALARDSGLRCISVALHSDLEFTVRKVHSFYDEHPGEMVTIVVRAYDIVNVKAILRGLSQHVTPSEILDTVMPVGELNPDMLSELSRTADPRAAIDLLATLAFPFAIPLLRLRSERPGAGTPEMELALEQWYYEEAFEYLQRSQLAEGILSSALQLDCDITNLLTVIRLADLPEEHDFLRAWLSTDDITRIFVGPGVLSFDTLARAGRQESMNALVDTLVGTAYEVPLRSGLAAYVATGRLSEVEKHLNHYRLGWLSRLVSKDPLGIGVVLGYIALKTTEIANIRWIARGIYIGMTASSIWSELVFPA